MIGHILYRGYMKQSIDYLKLENKIYKKAYRLADVKDRVEKVAFDIVKFKDSDSGANLWQIQNADDGEYIVALYQNDEEIKTASNWDISVVKTAGAIQISYKGDPLVTLASSKLGIPQTDLSKVKEYLPAKLAENKKLVSALLKELSPSVRQAVINKYPELV